MMNKIISGGQTGADLAALDIAISYKISYGGSIPKGRLTEDGPLDEKYQLQEMATDSYPKRTAQNVLDSDGTLIISNGKLSGGSELTSKLASKHNKPCLHIDLEEVSMHYAVRLLRFWLISSGIHTLNVAGPRASGDPKIYGDVTELFDGLLAGSHLVAKKV